MTRYVFTSANAAYTSKVAALSESVHRHEPGVRFVWAVVESSDTKVPDVGGVDEYLRLRELDRDWDHHLVGRRVVEACTAVKGAVLKHLLARDDCESVVYLDPDVFVYGPLSPIWDALRDASIVLTPHLLVPSATEEGIRDNEISALKHGIFNLGFLAVRPTRSGQSFAAWWDHRLWEYCIDAPERGLFTDQRWIDHVPVFFEQVAILRDAGCNVASWNLGERDVAELDDQLVVNGVPLVFWHFSSVDTEAHVNMTAKYGRGDLPRRISLHYRAALRAYQEQYARQIPGWSLRDKHPGRTLLLAAARSQLSSAIRLMNASPAGSIAKKLLPRKARSAIYDRLLSNKR